MAAGKIRKLDMEFQSARRVAEDCDVRLTKIIRAIGREKRGLSTMKREGYTFLEMQSAFRRIEFAIKPVRKSLRKVMCDY